MWLCGEAFHYRTTILEAGGVSKVARSNGLTFSRARLFGVEEINALYLDAQARVLLHRIRIERNAEPRTAGHRKHSIGIQ